MTRSVLPAICYARPHVRLHISIWIASFLLILVCSRPALAVESRDCPQKDGAKTVRNVHGFKIIFTSTKDDDQVFGYTCTAELQDAAGHTVLSKEDADFSLVKSDADINGDGIPDLVLESYSGGAHCCWTYYFISLGASPHLIKQLENERGVALFRNPVAGRFELLAQDGAFDYFDGQCHGCTVFPIVYLRLEGDRLVDAGSQHMQDYDAIIAKSRQSLTADELKTFRSAKTDPYETDDVSNSTAQKVESIVFAYLYSGRENEAHQALENMWPPFDKERMWNLILATRQKGILSETRATTR